MKSLLVVATIVSLTEVRTEYDGDGILKLFNNSNLPNMFSDFDVKFYLHTRNNPEVAAEIISEDVASLTASGFNISHPTRIIIHGWLKDHTSPYAILLRDSYLKRGEFNVILVDWSAGGGSINYIKSRFNVDDAGLKLAVFLDFLNNNGVSSNDIYLIGHSLGAHVAGFAGKLAANKPNTIYGLDPTLPLFSRFDESSRLAASDAGYVQTILSDGGIFGFDVSIGQGNFYPGKGRNQPGCLTSMDIFCSHKRAFQYFAESLQEDNRFVGKKCHWVLILLGICLSKTTELMGGEPSNPTITGDYYVPVNAESPYAKGNVF